MNYNNETLRNALAAEYVLGTMRGGARRRFKQLIMSNQRIADTTSLWEQYLNGMGEQVPPIEPADKVWSVIERRLGFVPDSNKVTQIHKQDKPRMNWAYILVAASFIFAVLVTSMQWQGDIAPVTKFAVINDVDTNPLWLIEISEEELIVRPTDKLALLSNQDYELWIVPASGDAPVSLGVMPQSGRFSGAAPDALTAIDFSVLAVSLEPLGGSPTGQPTEVLYTASVSSV